MTENDLDDESLVSCLESDMDMLKVLADIIPSLGRRVKFVNNFKKQLNDNGGAEQVSARGVSTHSTINGHGHASCSL